MRKAQHEQSDESLSATPSGHDPDGRSAIGRRRSTVHPPLLIAHVSWGNVLCGCAERKRAHTQVNKSLKLHFRTPRRSKSLEARVVRRHRRARAGLLAERLPHWIDAPHPWRCLGSAIPCCPRGWERQRVCIGLGVARFGPIEDGGPAARRRLRSCVRKRARRDGLGVGALANGGPESNHQGDPAAARVSSGHAATARDLPCSGMITRQRWGGDN